MKRICTVAVFSFLCGVVLATSCPPQPDEHYDFIALVTICNIEKGPKFFSDHITIYKSDFEIIECYKGPELSHVLYSNFFSEVPGAYEKIPLYQNTEWLIFAKFSPSNNNFMSGYCSGNFLYRSFEGMRNWVNHNPNHRIDKYREKYLDFTPWEFEGDTLIEYYSNGNIEYIEPYQTKKLHGLAKRFYPSGKIYKIENHRNGKLDGIQKRFSKKGNLISLKTYKEGSLNGLSAQYFKDGTIWKKKIYHHDKIEIEERFYSKSKQRSRLTTYDFSTCTETTKKWTKQGIIKDQYISYYNGTRENFTYNHKGKLISKRSYNSITKENSYEKF